MDLKIVHELKKRIPVQNFKKIREFLQNLVHSEKIFTKLKELREFQNFLPNSIFKRNTHEFQKCSQNQN